MSPTQILCPQQILRARANRETFVSATLCPRLPPRLCFYDVNGYLSIIVMGFACFGDFVSFPSFRRFGGFMLFRALALFFTEAPRNRGLFGMGRIR